MSRTPAAWYQLQSVQFRRLAHSLGNAALTSISRWPSGPPSGGDGRAVKAACERLVRLTESTTLSGNARISANLNEILREFREIEKNPFFHESLSTKNYNGSHESGTYGALVEKNIQRIESFLDFNSEILAIDLNEVARIAPNQELSPLQFQISDDKLTIRSIPSGELIEDRKLTSSARSLLVEQGDEVISELEGSNCDRRFLDHMRFVQHKLETAVNIVQLGLTSQAATVVLDKYSDELPSITSAKSQAYLLGISQYAGQFPEWRRFCEQASSLELDQSDANLAKAAVESLLPQLKKSTSSIDPEIPKSFQFIIDCVSDPKDTSKRVTYGLVRTLENFSATIFLSVVDYVKSLHQGANTGIRRGTAGLMALSLVVAAIQCARSLTPTASKIPGLTWLERAADVMDENLPALIKPE